VAGADPADDLDPVLGVAVDGLLQERAVRDRRSRPGRWRHTPPGGVPSGAADQPRRTGRGGHVRLRHLASGVPLSFGFYVKYRGQAGDARGGDGPGAGRPVLLGLPYGRRPVRRPPRRDPVQLLPRRLRRRHHRRLIEVNVSSPAHEFFGSRKLRLAPQDYSPWTPPTDRLSGRSYPPAWRHPPPSGLVARPSCAAAGWLCTACCPCRVLHRVTVLLGVLCGRSRGGRWG